LRWARCRVWSARRHGVFTQGLDTAELKIAKALRQELE
jgi:hypothetical protein